ncbi:hypothetical protein [Psychroflexus sp. MBR-150]|jgi:hypothetical protein
MTLNSCSGQNKNSKATQTEETVKKVMNDTIFISKAQFQIMTNKMGVLDIEVIGDNLIAKIANSKNPILKIELGDNYIIAKGNNIFNSSVPSECDYFYPLSNDNKIVTKGKHTINLRKIDKVTE